MTILKNIKENKGRVTLASVLIVSLMLVTAGLYIFVSETNAAAITSAKDVLSTSSPGAAANHTFTFTINDPIDAGETLTIDVADGTFTFGTAGFANTDAKDYDIDDDGVDKVVTADGACAANQFEIDSIVSSTFQFTYCAGSTSIATGSVMTVQIGTHADTSGGIGDTQMTNPAKVAAAGTADTPTITIGGTFSGTGDMLVAIIEGVAVTVTVDESLSFTIAGVTNTSCTQGGSATQVTTTTGTVPFGTTAVNTFYKGCHDLTVSTNAASGYSITTEENRSLFRTTGAGDVTINDAICDAADDCTSVIAAGTTSPWATATANHGFGYTCSGSACNAAFATATEFNAFACRSSVAAECDPVDGPLAIQTPITSAAAVSAEVSRIVYKLSVSATQPAGAYSNTVTYIATPTF